MKRALAQGVVVVVAVAGLLLAPAVSAQTGSRPGETREFGGITFVWCPPGSFDAGTARSPEAIAEAVGGDPAWYADESPPRPVTFDRGFWISRDPITVAEWVRIGRAAELGTPGGAAGSDRPVTGVNQSEVRAFAEALGQATGGTFRLPTEDEWEYACRAGSDTLYPHGDDPDALGEYAWYRGNAPDSRPQPVGQKQPNAWGLRDMLGNTWEWCGTPYAVRGTHDGAPSRSHLVIRGGSVTSPAGFTRSAYRAGRTAATGHALISFRLVREP